jgi:hypothetical protein
MFNHDWLITRIIIKMMGQMGSLDLLWDYQLFGQSMFVISFESFAPKLLNVFKPQVSKINHIIEDAYISDCEMIMVHDLVHKWIHFWRVNVHSQLPIESKKFICLVGLVLNQYFKVRKHNVCVKQKPAFPS